MKMISLVAVVSAVSSGSALAGILPGAVEFGTLTDGYGSAISFDAGGGNTNTDFIYQNHASNGGFLTMGLSTQVHYAGSPITNNGADTFYSVSGANQSGIGQPGSGNWAFKWSVTFNDGVGGTELGGYRMALRIDGPSGGSWGNLNYDYATAIGVNPTDYTSQNIWVPSYDFMQVDSETQYGPGAAGAWSGMGYNFDELGTYSISIRVFDNNNAEVGTLAMNTVVVPGVGGLAALGGLGLVGRRRRR